VLFVAEKLRLFGRLASSATHRSIPSPHLRNHNLCLVNATVHHQHDGSAPRNLPDDVSTALTLLSRKASRPPRCFYVCDLSSENFAQSFPRLLQRFLGQLVLAFTSPRPDIRCALRPDSSGSLAAALPVCAARARYRIHRRQVAVVTAPTSPLPRLSSPCRINATPVEFPARIGAAPVLSGRGHRPKFFPHSLR